MVACNCARCATSRSGPWAAAANRSRASLNFRAWNSFMADSKLANCCCAVGCESIPAWARAAEARPESCVFWLFAMSRFVARLSLIFETVGFFFSGMSAPLRLRQLGFYSRGHGACATGIGGASGQPCIPQELSRFFRRRRIDVKAAAPFEPRHFRQLGNDLQVPMVVRQKRLLHRSAVNDEIVGRPLEHFVDLAQRRPDNPGQVGCQGGVAVFKVRFVPLRQDPGFKREPRRIRLDYGEPVCFGYQARARRGLLPDDVAVDAPLLEVVELPGSVEFFLHRVRNHRQRNELRMRMLERSAGGLAVVAEQHDVAEAAVLF